ncbi:MAG: hypothetical protein AB8B74_04920 [Crocinitomicaceae bacterium]
MKKLSIIVSITLLCLMSLQSKEKLVIAAFDTLKLSYEQFKDNDIELYNNSMKAISVSVLDPATNIKVKSFGLGPFGKALVRVNFGHVLNLKNSSSKVLSINLKFIKRKAIIQKNIERIDFKLINPTTKSIPLVIPGVMNPNLSPNSSSGVNLKIGQKVYYKKNGRSKLLLIVNKNIQEGDELNVAELISKLEKDN